jgi:hypothetical protein
MLTGGVNGASGCLDGALTGCRKYRQELKIAMK